LKPPHVISEPVIYLNESSLITSIIGHTTAVLTEQKKHIHPEVPYDPAVARISNFVMTIYINKVPGERAQDWQGGGVYCCSQASTNVVA